MSRYDGFDVFVAAHSAALSRTAFFLTGDNEQAEDLLQEALTKTAARWPRVRDDNPRAYVRQVMLNHVRSVWRRSRRMKEHPIDDLSNRASDTDTATQVSDAAALMAALRLLGARQRAVLYLRFYEDRTEAETARQLGCSIGTVKSQTHDALARLRVIAPSLAPEPAASEANE